MRLPRRLRATKLSRVTYKVKHGEKPVRIRSGSQARDVKGHLADTKRNDRDHDSRVDHGGVVSVVLHAGGSVARVFGVIDFGYRPIGFGRRVQPENR